MKQLEQKSLVWALKSAPILTQYKQLQDITLQQECAAGEEQNPSGTVGVGTGQCYQTEETLCENMCTVNMQCCHKHTVVIPFRSYPAESLYTEDLLYRTDDKCKSGSEFPPRKLSTIEFLICQRMH